MKITNKIYSLIILIIGIAVASGCKQDALMTDLSGFNVVTPKTSYAVGDTVRFTITGNTADFLVFYSGEVGRRYQYANRVSQSGINKLVFQTSMQQGAAIGTASPDSLKLLISTNLAGYDSTSIVNATWVDITSRNTKWPASLATTYTTSDSVDISDFSYASKINIAFRYIGKSTATAQRKYQIQNLTLSNNLPDGTNTPLFSAPFLGNTTISGTTIAPASSFTYTGWVECSLLNNSNAWNVGTWKYSATNAVNNTSGIAIRTAYPISFDPGTALNNVPNDDWLITSAVDLKTVKPDAGVVLQDKSAVAPVLKYNYVFKQAGNYVVTFVAANQTSSSGFSVAKQVVITVQ
jgi:hypothetical protein